LNPGMSSTFPWLSTQAQAWESYRFNKLRFCAYTRCATSVPGSLMLIPDYDAADAAPATEQIASSYEDVEEGVPWKDSCAVLKPAAMHALGPRKFIRQGALSANQDIKTYDAGSLFVGTTDGTAVNWSKLWVEYDVTLFTPQLPSGGAYVGTMLHTQSLTAPTTAAPLGATVTTVPVSNSPCTFAGQVLTFTKTGVFSIVYNAIAGTSVTGAAGFSLGANVTALLTFGTAGVTIVGSGTTNYTCQMLVSVAAVNSTVTINNVTFVAGTSSELMVIQVPPSQG